MSGTFPTSPGFTEVRTRLKHYNLSSESVNGRVQVRSLSSTRRDFTLRFPPMTKTEFDPIYAFIDSQEGMLGTFSITLPDPDNPASTFTITARLANDVQEFSLGVDNLYEFEVDIIEVV